MDDYRVLNRASWDERVPAHAASPDYMLERFVEDPDFLSGVVRFDVPRLGDISGLRGVHLQCHIGTDTVSLARLGARMSGLDFSTPAIEQAQGFADRLGLEVDFHQAEVYDAVEVLGAASYDLVFTGIGAIGWLPSIERWANTVAGLLKPGGRLFIREGHPMLWSLEGSKHPGLITLGYPYFETEEPMVWDEGGTYVATDVEFQHNVTHEWNHGLAEIMNALMAAGMEIIAFDEHDSVPWEALPGHMTFDPESGEWRLTEHPGRLPASYTLQARRR
ncbi:bifunctional 2-polyprenyl-6-hydroxyphenol methylase/3-demethylubiquinol 3-O-methyltransferase UbiG [Kribbella sp. VKM Ac-2568]|uniref:class I SAM-dependent methyltransferase n=1 Tax=Kribbella sp. VKM Ac-2568 TaxID=2512219 RepID=UPI0010494CF6|nr:class I SAM-dependent methyltransferase [Kribbella sp. VKM Ac-2568]TCM45571.1 methyltransferase family protein [Kribbella sp. VKM Ac-2568]